MTYQCLFILIATIIRTTIGCIQKKKKVSKDLIKQELSDDNIIDLLRDFTKNEWSEENLLSYLDVCEYKDIIKKSKKDSVNENFSVEQLLTSYQSLKPDEIANTKELKVGQIFHLYLNGSKSPCEINIDYKRVKILKDSINETKDLTENLFDKIEEAIKINLSDTYSRFVVSPSYISYKKSLAFVEKQM